MKEILNWTLDTLRSDNAMMSWLEERRYEWAPLIKDAIVHIMNGASVMLVTDNEREWLSRYIVSNINNPSKNRPFFPIYEMNKLIPNLDYLVATQNMQVASDMLDISFKDHYFYWYIGRANHQNATIAKDFGHSLLWMMDEEVQNSFFLRSADELIDLKLMHMVRLFDKTLDAVMIGELEV
ncbi:MAG: hypothetical protein QG567_1115 [Campylobacterota bacterium]|nr:hypothetical protein [Campylobacterota bacterium]